MMIVNDDGADDDDDVDADDDHQTKINKGPRNYSFIKQYFMALCEIKHRKIIFLKELIYPNKC